MVVGFNHNFSYKGELFHVQTEDSGLKSPHITTLLYRGGTILASKKTSYADITKVEKLEQVVEELMKDQHREMLRRLKNGDFDDIIAGRLHGAVAPPPVAAHPKPPPPATPEPLSQPEIGSRPTGSLPSPPVPPAPAASREQRATIVEASLDEIILSYLIGDDGKS